MIQTQLNSQTLQIHLMKSARKSEGETKSVFLTTEFKKTRKRSGRRNYDQAKKSIVDWSNNRCNAFRCYIICRCSLIN